MFFIRANVFYSSKKYPMVQHCFFLLHSELDHLKGLSENHGNTKDTPTQRLSQFELQQARQEVVQAQESLKVRSFHISPAFCENLKQIITKPFYI